MVCENRLLRRIFGPRREEVIRRWRKLYKGEVHKLYSSLDIARMNGKRSLRWTGPRGVNGDADCNRYKHRWEVNRGC